jgi:Histidine kinase
VHPILASRVRQGLYLAVWAGIAALLVGVLMVLEPRPIGHVVLFIAPLVLLYAIACLSAWWVCRANPLGTTPLERLLAVVGSASLQASVMWMVLGTVWALVLERVAHIGPDRAGLLRDVLVLGAAGVVLYAQSMAGHWFLLAQEGARDAERRVFSSQVAAREAELRALRAQLNPHFLFNSLNSISALVGSSPEAARRMCQLLGEFLRTSLSLGARKRVAFGEELALAERSLAVEQVRFGERLMFEKQVSDSAARCMVPPLLIQPLIENAVKHGVADRIEGGTVHIEATVHDGVLEISVENPRDPDAPPRRGHGLGLENVRQRLSALDPRGSRVDVFPENQSFRVRLTLTATDGETEGEDV